MSPLCRSVVQAWRHALLVGGLCTAVYAHDTIIFDAKEAAKYSIDGAWGQSTPIVLHGQATAILRPEGLEIALTMADGAAYKLLDPGQTTAGVANSTTDVNDTQFTQDKPLLIARARTFFKVANNGAELPVGSVNVELTAARDTVFHLIYPNPAPGTLDVGLTYLGQIPAGEKELITVLDHTGTTLGSATLGVDNPSLEVTVPAPGTFTAAGKIEAVKPWLIFGASLVVVIALLVALNKFRRTENQ